MCQVLYPKMSILGKTQNLAQYQQVKGLERRENQTGKQVSGLSPVSAAFLTSFTSSLLQWERNCGFEELMALRMAKRKSSLKCGSAAMGSAQPRTAKAAQAVEASGGTGGRHSSLKGIFCLGQRICFISQLNPDAAFHMARGLLCSQGAQNRDI